MAPPTLLNLPPEIQHNIVSRLRYPDLARLCMVNRYLRDLSARKTKRRALRKYENHWFKCMQKEGEMLDFETVFPPQARRLLRKGDPQKDIEKLSSFAPCSGCRRLRDASKFSGEEPNFPRRLSDYSYVYGVHKRNSKQECIDCYLHHHDYSKRESRWLFMSNYHLVACRGCHDEVRETVYEISKRQKMAELCDECFEADEMGWEAFKQKLGNTNESLKAQTERMEGYLEWMSDMEESYCWFDPGMQPPSLTEEPATEPIWKFLENA